jgi:hypothetical protein
MSFNVYNLRRFIVSALYRTLVYKASKAGNIGWFSLPINFSTTCFTLLQLSFCRNLKSDRATIHKNLVGALGIADVIFLVAVAVQPDGVISILFACIQIHSFNPVGTT